MRFLHTPQGIVYEPSDETSRILLKNTFKKRRRARKCCFRDVGCWLICVHYPDIETDTMVASDSDVSVSQRKPKVLAKPTGQRVQTKVCYFEDSVEIFSEETSPRIKTSLGFGRDVVILKTLHYIKLGTKFHTEPYIFVSQRQHAVLPQPPGHHVRTKRSKVEDCVELNFRKRCRAQTHAIATVGM